MLNFNFTFTTKFNIKNSSVLLTLCIYLAQMLEQTAVISPFTIQSLVLITESLFTARYELNHYMCTVRVSHRVFSHPV
jgi:hypothetical protein